MENSILDNKEHLRFTPVIIHIIITISVTEHHLKFI